MTLYNRCLQDIVTLLFKVKHSLVQSCVNISDLFNLKNTQYSYGIVTSNYQDLKLLDLVGIQ